MAIGERGIKGGIYDNRTILFSSLNGLYIITRKAQMKVIKIMWEVECYGDAAMQLIEHDLVTKCAKHSIRGFDSEDLAQELRLHIWRKLSKYDCTKAGFRTWANMVMRNRLKDIHKRTIMPRRDLLTDKNTTFDEFL